MMLEATNRPSRLLETLAMYWPLAGLGGLLLYTFKLHAYAYFGLDDFANLYWVQQVNGREMLSHVVNPFSAFFRPAGMAVYWAVLQCCDLDPLAYRVAAWLGHSLNVALMYLFLARVLGSRYAAATGTVLFVFQAIFIDIYWNFGTIFEIVSTFWFLLALNIHARFRPSVWRALAVIAIYLMAFKGKEMAITLPVILLLHDLLRPGEDRGADSRFAVKSLGTLLVPFVMTVWFAVAAGVLSSAVAPDHPYYMERTLTTVGRGYGWYFDRLFHTRQPWALYFIMGALLFAVFAWRRQRQGLFFLLYTWITLSPVILLVNHRFNFYWYLPFLGVSGLIGLLVKSISALAEPRLKPRAGLVAAMVLFAFFCREQYITQKDLGGPDREWTGAILRQYRAFVEGLRGLAPFEEGHVLYLVGAPSHFSDVTVHYAAQVALRRTDVDARLVESFPPDAVYRLRFDNEKLTLESPAER